MSRRRRIAIVTGTRAEYGLLASTMRAIDAHPRLELQLVVTGIHLLREFGHTARHITRDGWHIDARVKMQRGSDDPLDQAAGLARGVAGIARYLESAQTDIVVVLGDRIEAMAGALAAVTTGRILAHIHGGDVAPGDFDDSLRHAITKLAHIHLPATKQAARRIIRMGEQPDRVHVVGAPGLDRLRELLATPWSDTPLQSWAAAGNYALVVYHAWGRAATTERRAMSVILRAVESRGLRRLILYPNTDRGHRGVLDAISQHERRHTAADVRVARSLPRDEYLQVLIHADVIVGNSSSGVIEAPAAGTTAINIGPPTSGPAGGRVGGHRCRPYAIRDPGRTGDRGVQALPARARHSLRRRPHRSESCQDTRTTAAVAGDIAQSHFLLGLTRGGHLPGHADPASQPIAPITKRHIIR